MYENCIMLNKKIIANLFSCALFGAIYQSYSSSCTFYVQFFLSQNWIHFKVQNISNYLQHVLFSLLNLSSRRVNFF